MSVENPRIPYQSVAKIHPSFIVYAFGLVPDSVVPTMVHNTLYIRPPG